MNGLSFGALLFLLASGFTLVFGLMRIVNLAHGSLYLVGGYAGVVTAAFTGSFFLALVVGALVAGMVGLGTERVLLRRVRGQDQMGTRKRSWLSSGGVGSGATGERLSDLRRVCEART